MQTPLDLKGALCPKASLRRNDFIYHHNSLFKCTNKALLSFQNIDTKQSIILQLSEYWRLDVLQLVPIKWEVDQNQVTLVGRELGLGPQYTCKVVGFRQFEELNVVNRQAARGKKMDYYVELAEIKGGTFYILNIQIR